VHNNPIVKPETWAADYEYLVYQLEQAPETGTKHYQGFVTFNSAKRLSGLKKLNKTVHWKPCDNKRGGAAGAIKYCTKEETRLEGPFEFGTRPTARQGKRNDILGFRDAIVQANATDRQLFTDDNACIVMAKYPKLATSIRQTFELDQRQQQTKCIVFWGPPRTGKTTAAVKYATDRNLSYYTPPEKQNDDNNLWWDGYSGQDVVIINEMSGSYMKPDLLIKLLDKQRISLPIKGSSVPFNSKYIIFTSNQPPKHWWSTKALEKWPGVIRRLTEPEARVYYCKDVIPDDPTLWDESEIPDFGIRDTTGFSHMSPQELPPGATQKKHVRPQRDETYVDLGLHDESTDDVVRPAKRPKTTDSAEYEQRINELKKKMKKPFA